MLYLSEVYLDVVQYFDESGNIFIDTFDTFFNKKDIYGRKEDVNYIAVPLVKKEWVLYSDRELNTFVKANQVEILKFKLQGINSGVESYLLPSNKGYSYYSFNGQAIVNTLHIVLYNKSSREIVLDKYYQVIDNMGYVTLRYFNENYKKLQKSNEDFSMPTIFYRDGEWYFFTNIGDKYEIKIKELIGV